MNLMAIIVILVVLALVLFFWEYRIRRPDQIVLTDKRGKIIQRKGRFYPRHFSLAIPATMHLSQLEVESEARGKLPLRIKLAFTTAPDEAHLEELVRSGGWNENPIIKAAQECEVLIQGMVKEFTEQYEVDELKSETLRANLEKHLRPEIGKLGLKLINLAIQSLDPVDPEIADAMQQQEAARIREKTEKVNQKARLEAARHRLDTDEKIQQLEHKLNLHQFELKQKEQEKEAELARYRVEKEIERRQMQFEMEQKELQVFKSHPELLLLTPQLARLAEASQQLKNARTVVSLAGGDQQKVGQLFDVLEQFVQKVLGQKNND